MNDVLQRSQFETTVVCQQMSVSVQLYVKKKKEEAEFHVHSLQHFSFTCTNKH